MYGRYEVYGRRVRTNFMIRNKLIDEDYEPNNNSCEAFERSLRTKFMVCTKLMDEEYVPNL